MFTVQLKPPYLDPGLYASPGVMPVVRELLGEDCIIQSFGVVCAYPGARMQHVHRDHPPLFAEAGGLNAFFPPFALHVVVPLIDLDEHTGTTALWEGSHRIKSAREEGRWSKEQMERLEGAVLPMPKMGDSYLMDYRLRHTGTPNISERPRPILYMVYSRRWFLDRRNFEIQSPLQIDRNEFEGLSEEHKRLFEIARPAN
jgi:ectoine hydroxylase-related dioxygenase (phytanoyl-CoA dioxygenase family)